MCARESNYRLLVAHNYLRNISLDGSHDDTVLHMFNRPGLPDVRRVYVISNYKYDVLYYLYSKRSRTYNSEYETNGRQKVVTFDVDSSQADDDYQQLNETLVRQFVLFYQAFVYFDFRIY
jgi:hypothetical protein